MKIKVLYFGMIAEMAKCSEQLKEVEGDSSINDLINQILIEMPDLKEINYVVAQNQLLIDGNKQLTDGDEISVFPPFAGG